MALGQLWLSLPQGSSCAEQHCGDDRQTCLPKRSPPVPALSPSLPSMPAPQLGDVGLARLQQGTALSRSHPVVGTFDCEEMGFWGRLLLRAAHHGSSGAAARTAHCTLHTAGVPNER